MDYFNFNNGKYETRPEQNAVYQQYMQQQNNKNEINQTKSKYKTIIAVVIIVLLLINVMFLTILSLNVDKLAQSAINKYIESASNTIVDNVQDKIMDKVQNEIDKDNYLPSDYVSAAQYVGKHCIGSVLELYCSNGSVASRGSGFVISNKGYIITNAHVILNETTNVFGTPVYKLYTTLKANFANKTESYNLQVIAYDSMLDLAILKLPSTLTNLKPVEFGDSNLLTFGEDLVVLGNAQGLGTSVTQGSVSRLPSIVDNVEVIQTDAAINPGNSGGPVFNAIGKFMGVASFKIVTDTANEGLGFAISSNETRKYIQKIEAQKKITIL